MIFVCVQTQFYILSNTHLLEVQVNLWINLNVTLVAGIEAPVTPSKVSKRKSTDTELKESTKKHKIESRSKTERRRSETKVEVDGQIETHTTLSPKTPPGDPPEPEELIKVIFTKN